MIFPVPGSFKWLAQAKRSGGIARVARRQSDGQVQEIPVIPVRVEGRLYVVSTRGEADWVRNVRAAGGKASSRHGRSAGQLAPGAEFDYVLDQMSPRIEKAFLAKGLVLLHWADAGWPKQG